MRKFLVIIFAIVAYQLSAQSVDHYFESIRDNRAALTAFFAQMPKGGDLHNHYSGSVYAETYIDYVVGQDYAINKKTLDVRTIAPAGTDWVRFSQLNESGELAGYKEKLIQKWSVKDYNGISCPSDQQFFETFGGFSIANKGAGRLDTGLLELKRRAIKENVTYIETMFTGIYCDNLRNIDTSYNHKLEEAQRKGDEAATTVLLEELYAAVESRNVKACAAAFDNELMQMHKRLGIDDSLFTMRYQNYVTRVTEPTDVFKNLVLSFESAAASPLVVGVNIVAPENNEISMRDYWLHMQMFRFCHKKFPSVKYSMHAGELALGMVKPEELTWHINAAVHMAGADRIGHGVDMPYEKNCYSLLQYMAEKQVAIEINLYSNEFILKVKGDAHPITLYKEFGVPIVISSDDAGVLRSNLTEQYVLLAYRYRNISYADIKDFVYNSIDYSFIKERGLKEKLKSQLDERFYRFERMVMETHK